MSARQQPEYRLQCRVVDLLDKLPCIVLYHHSPNGSKLYGNSAQRERTGARLKRSGTKAGYPDLILYASEGRVGHLELKSETGRLTDTQKAIQASLAAAGHRYAVVRHTDDVMAALAEWGWVS